MTAIYFFKILLKSAKDSLGDGFVLHNTIYHSDSLPRFSHSFYPVHRTRDYSVRRGCCLGIQKNMGRRKKTNLQDDHCDCVLIGENTLYRILIKRKTTLYPNAQ